MRHRRHAKISHTSKIDEMRGNNVSKRIGGSNKNYPNASNVVVANTVLTNYSMPPSLLKAKSLAQAPIIPDSKVPSKVNLTSLLRSIDISKSQVVTDNNINVVNIQEDTSCYKRGSEGTVGDFSDSIYIDGDHINVQNKCYNVHASGEYHTVEKQVRHAYIKGYNNHIKASIQHISASGSHAYVVNSGEQVLGTDFEVDGVKKVGKAQSGRLLMSALVNDRGIAFLVNSKSDKIFNQYIYFSDSKVVVLVSIKYVIVNKDGNYSTGVAHNTVRILSNGCSEWVNEKFTMVDNSNTFPYNITFSGVNVTKYNNGTSIQVQNEQGNGDIQVLAKVKMLSLQH